MVERRTSESGLDVWMVIGVPALPAVPAPLPPARGAADGKGAAGEVR